MLADVAEMPGPALLAVHWELQEGPRLPALLSRGAPVSKGVGEPLKLGLVLALTYLPVLRRPMALFEIFFAPAAYEDSVFEPLLSMRLLGRMSLPLFSGNCLLHNSTQIVNISTLRLTRRCPP